MVAVKMGQEYMAQTPELQPLFLKLKLRAFAAVYHIQSAAMFHNSRRRLMLHGRLGRTAS